MAKRTKKATAVSEEFMFHQGLWNFYLQKRNEARKKYKYATKKFLDFNNPDKSNAFLRKSQYEAFEMYIFLKEYLDNRPLNKIFEDWYDKKGLFHDRTEWGDTNLFGEFNAEQYRKAFEVLGQGNKYPNYIYALTMGTGKTFLMATSICLHLLCIPKNHMLFIQGALTRSTCPRIGYTSSG